MRDAINLADVEILQSPDVHDWPITTALTTIEFRPNNVLVDFTKKDGPERWPDAVTPGWDGPLQYTLWVVLLEQKLTCGCIQLWHGRDGVGGPFSKAAQDWWFRVPKMAPIQPHAGDQVGFFVTAGDARLRATPTSVHERSNIVVLTVPANDSGVFTFPAEEPAVRPPVLPSQPPAPAEPPPAPPDGDSLIGTVAFRAAVLERLDRVAAANEQLLALLKGALRR